MLKHDVLVQQLERYTRMLVDTYSQKYMRAQSLWGQLINDEQYARALAGKHADLPIPHWQENLKSFCQVQAYDSAHRVFAVDGSQIYPDRHQGLPLYVINIGIADFLYGVQSRVHFETIPHLFYAQDNELGINDPEIINCQRSELELKQGLLLSHAEVDCPMIFLCDGSLIAWHLLDGSSISKKEFLINYLKLFEQFRETKALIAGYISLPKSRDLLALVRAACIDLKEEDPVFPYLVDTDLLRDMLPPFSRTPIFESRVALSEQYPQDIRTHFFYVNVGAEIARVEIPAWIAGDKESIFVLEQIIVSQVQKGQGYPICLAEAHEQAVITSVDREAFYQTIRLMFQKQGIAYSVSQKSIKKRGLGV